MTIRAFFSLMILVIAPLGFAQQPSASPSPAIANPPTANPSRLRELISQLNQNGLQDVIEQLRSNYVDPNALTNQQLNAAAVEGLLSRLGPGARLQTKEQAEQPAPDRPFKSELIGNDFGYIRLGNFKKEQLPQLDGMLNDLRTRGASGAILDLRTMPAVSDFQLAADVVERFASKGKLLFKLVQPKDHQERVFTSSLEPLFSGPLAVLVDNENGGTAEAIAGALRHDAHALVIGQKTSGQAVEYQRYLIADRFVLTLAVSELVIPDSPAIFPDGLKPDLPVAFPKQQQDRVLTLGDEKGIQDLIFDEERPHTNEAALVAGKNPDLDAYEANQRSGKGWQPKPKDLALQRAIDFLTTIKLYRR